MYDLIVGHYVAVYPWEEFLEDHGVEHRAQLAELFLPARWEGGYNTVYGIHGAVDV